MNNIKMKPGELYRLKEDIQYYDQPPVAVGSIFMVVEVKDSYLITVLVGEHMQTWDIGGFTECEKIS